MTERFFFTDNILRSVLGGGGRGGRDGGFTGEGPVIIRVRILCVIVCVTVCVKGGANSFGSPTSGYLKEHFRGFCFFYCERIFITYAAGVSSSSSQTDLPLHVA